MTDASGATKVQLVCNHQKDFQFCNVHHCLQQSFSKSQHNVHNKSIYATHQSVIR